ncbi:MAG: hypothetical protein ACPGF6_06860 [Porticoccaceae bacterium]
MTHLFKKIAVAALFLSGQSAVQAHNADGTAASVLHFFTAADHLGFLALFAVVLSVSFIGLHKFFNQSQR